MVPPLYSYQKKIIDADPKWCGIFLGTGTGKTRVCLELMEGNTLVICPKQQFLEDMWEKKRKEFEIDGSIKTVSKEYFRKDWGALPQFDTVIIDEGHHFLGVTPNTRVKRGVEYPKTSRMYETLMLYLKKFPPKRFYICTATPVSKPMNLYALATLFGHTVDYLTFRSKYYTYVPIGSRYIWKERTDKKTKDLLAKGVKKLGYVGKMEDFVEVPEQTHLMPDDIPFIELTKEQKEEMYRLLETEADPLVMRGKERTIQNGVLYTKEIVTENGVEKMIDETVLFTSNKISAILGYAEEFPKILIFANYTAQIEAIAEALRKNGYKVSTLTGKTKDRSTLIETAEKDEAHIVVAQCTISEGYELPSFPCVIYASKSWQFVHYEQSLGRVLRRNKLKKNLYIHLVTKGADYDCHRSIMSGKDFQERLSYE